MPNLSLKISPTVRRVEISLWEALKNDALLVGTKDQKLPYTRHCLETMKKALKKRNVQKAGYGKVAVWNTDPLEVSLFWPGEKSDIPVVER